MCISFEPSANRKSLSVRVSSAFLLEDAQQLDAALADADPEAEVDVDFRQVREWQGPALARLAEVLRVSHAHLALRGITTHEVKLLGYLGAPTARLEDRSSSPG